MKYAEIAVDAPTSGARTFSYSIPDDMTLAAGQLVRVPFGVRVLQGVVFELADSPQVEETRPVSEVQSAEPVLSQTQLDLARWMSDYYLCSLFEAAVPMLPPGARTRTRAYLSIAPGVDDLESDANSDAQLAALRAVHDSQPMELERLVDALGEGVRNSVAALVSAGTLARRYRATRPATSPKYVDSLRLNPAALDTVRLWLEEDGHRAPRQSELAEFIIESPGPIAASEARKMFGPSAVARFLERGWLEIYETQVFRDPLADRVFDPEPPVALSAAQSDVVRDVVDAIRDTARAPRIFLTQGVTGSGKTEIYLSAVEECLSLGKQAVVMVPEISLTPQTIERFAARFPGRVAALHSGLSDGQRFDQWWAIKRGERSVVVGSRGAVFAPVSDPGLFILDEEHEWTYKQHDGAPRYHARAVAIRMGEMTGAVTLLGSASPEVSSYHRALRGRYALHTLPDRISRAADGLVGVAPLPSVENVDMRRELREGNPDIFSRTLLAEIESCLDDGKQAILFLNRRGTASHLQCRRCGHSVVCRSCDVPLTYHRPLRRLICHYCGRRRRVPDNCPDCLSYRLSFYGIGTQSVAEAVGERFPQARTLRWDRDATRYPREYEELLSTFRNGEADILVGTQMIAKGLHLPGVTLVGVVLADVGLGIPDFRSSERAFQLLCQVAGRAGRGRETGKVVFQTYQPDNYAIRAAAAQDYPAFYEREIKYRREHRNPPYSRLIRLIHSHVNNAVCESRARALADELRAARESADMTGVDVLGPTPPYPPRLRGRYRWHVVLRGRNPRALLDMVALPRGWSVDIDPVALT